MTNRSNHGFPGSIPFLTGLLLLVLSVSTVAAQPAAPTAVRGTIGLLKDQDLIINTTAGDVRVVLTNKTVIRGETVIKLSEITNGMYLGTTATKQADGNFLASEVHVFSEDQRGTGEGHRPLFSAPESGATMTNANVERVEDVVVKDIKGRLMTLKYKSGEVKVLVPPEVPLVKRVLGDRTLLKSDAEVSVQASRNADGTLAATQITVRAAR
ncbi:MAG TPA: DUF5666 domain-containing protein [Candidatus Binatia bacterium]|nr:DUF5666 domain-containing protein [Candidatus Binatia bacterium]